MKRNNLLGYLMLAAMFFLAFVLYSGPTIPQAFASTLSFTSSVTTSVTGFAIPTGVNLSNGIVPFLLPIAVAGLLGILMGFLQITGDVNSLIIKLGLFFGCLLGMLSVGAAAANVVPVALTIVSAAYVITYLWKRV